MSDGAGPSARRRTRRSAALLLLGLFVAIVPGLLAGHEFLADQHVKSEFSPGGSWYSDRDFYFLMRGELPPSLFDLMRFEHAWTVAMATLALAPGVFLWWRWSGARFARVVGAACCAVACLAVCALAFTHPYFGNDNRGWTWCAVPVGGALMAAAFLAAPTPRVRDE